MSVLTLAEGTLFTGRYRIVRVIAHGGMGGVYEVVHTETDRHRALKVILPSFLQSEEMRGRFRQEARVTAHIKSDYIVDVLDAGIDSATQMPFLVMELLAGEELDKRLKRVGRLPPHEVVTYLHQTSLALDKTHRASIVHRDLKPGNLFLTERDDGSPCIKVLDFGIAKLVAEGATGPATQLLGTPLYMAPEQYQVGSKVSPAVDIFALGMIAFTLLTGKPYWQEEAAGAGSVYALIAAVMNGPRERACARASRRGVELPPAFDAWFATVTAPSPHQRFPTASAAIIALGEALGVPTAQRPSMPGSSGTYDVPAGLPPAASFGAPPQPAAHAPRMSQGSATSASSPPAEMAGAVNGEGVAHTTPIHTRPPTLAVLAAVLLGLASVAIAGGLILLRSGPPAAEGARPAATSVELEVSASAPVAPIEPSTAPAGLAGPIVAPATSEAPALAAPTSTAAASAPKGAPSATPRVSGKMPGTTAKPTATGAKPAPSATKKPKFNYD